MAYLRLIWIYYETESPIENDVDAVAFKIGANASDLHQILKHFFFLHDDGLWHQARCDKEILAFRDKSDKAKKSANARWENANAMRTHSDRNAGEPLLDANQEPRTNNQITTPQPPQGGIPVKRQSKTRTQKIGIDEFIAQCQKAGEKPIQPDDPIFDYLLRIGLPEEFGALAWEWFKRRYASNTQAGVRGWRQAFRNAVEGNWPRYWFQADDGTWQLTTAGKQAQADYHALQHQERAA